MPRAPSHVPGITRHSVTQCHVSGHYSTFIATTNPCARPRPSRRLDCLYGGSLRVVATPAGKWSFPTLSPQSLYRCLGPYPAAFLRCSYPFLPEGLRPHLRPQRFGTPDIRRNATSTTGLFRGCSHSITFKFPYLLDTQVAPTTGLLYAQGGRAIYTTHRPDGYPFRDVASLRA